MWITLTESDVRTALSSGEFAAYTTKALADGQASPLDEQIARVTKLVRGYVAGCTQNKLGPTGTIPEELEGAAVDLIAHNLASRLPLSEKLTGRLDARKDDADTLLKATANCKFAIEQPPNDEASNEDIPGAGRPRFNTKTRNFSREAQEGV